MTGMVFNIERYAVEDGPGIRTLIFLKGCPLSCEWCANPESQRGAAEVMYYSNKCTGCGHCVSKCPQHAISRHPEFGLVTAATKCTLCGLCTEVCCYGAREIMGKRMTVDEVMQEIEKDRMYYETSGGGITISGGEPLLQPDFVREIIKCCKNKDIHTAVETSLYAEKDTVIRAYAEVDLIFADIKHIDSDVHKQHTGVANERILENIKLLDGLGKQFILRVPFIPGFNDDVEVQKAIYTWASDLKNLLRIEILAYHRLALAKYQGLGRQYRLRELPPVDKAKLSYLTEIGAATGIKVRIGAI